MAGDFDTIVELRVQQDWSPRFTQIVQSNMGWDADTPVGTGSWYGLYTIGIFHLHHHSSTPLGRAEWFDDVKGTRTGINTNYSEVTGGLNWHPDEVARDPPGDPRRLRRRGRVRSRRRAYRITAS